MAPSLRRGEPSNQPWDLSIDHGKKLVINYINVEQLFVRIENTSDVIDEEEKVHFLSLRRLLIGQLSLNVIFFFFHLRIFRFQALINFPTTSETKNRCLQGRFRVKREPFCVTLRFGSFRTKKFRLLKQPPSISNVIRLNFRPRSQRQKLITQSTRNVMPELFPESNYQRNNLIGKKCFFEEKKTKGFIYAFPRTFFFFFVIIIISIELLGEPISTRHARIDY